MADWWQDVQYGFRLFKKSPAFSVVAILTLALGIGANTTIFSIVYAVLIRPFPFYEPQQIMVVWETQLQQGLPLMYASPPNYADWRLQNEVFDEMAAFDTRNVFLKQGEEQIRITGTRVMSSVFPLLGVNPLMGRWLQPEDDRPQSPRSVMLSYPFWRTRLAADPHITGKQLIFDNQPYTVVGVMPPAFQFPPPILIEGSLPDPPTEVWLSFAEDPSSGQRGAHYLTVLARLKPGINEERAKNDLQVMAKRLELAHPESNTGWGLTIVPLQDQVQGSSRVTLTSLLAAVGLVLLIACMNVANLLLARGASRQREYAIRSAMGASRTRLFRQIVIENLLLAATGCVAGLALSYFGIQLLLKFGPENIPRLSETSMNGAAMLFAVAISLISGLLCGLAPAFQSISRDQFAWLRESGNSSSERPGKTTFRKVLVIMEVSLAFILLIGAGLLFQSFLKMMAVQSGFQPSGVLTLRTTLSSVTHPKREDKIAAYMKMETALKQRPELDSAGFVFDIPLASDHQGTSVLVQGEPAPRTGEEPQASFTFATPGYFEAMSIAFLKGRPFTNNDIRGNNPVVLINETAARMLFGKEDPIGKSILVGFDTSKPREVVGLIRDVRISQLKEDPPATVYIPYYQVPWSGSMSLAVKTRISPSAAATTIKRVLQDAVPGVPVFDVRTMDQVVSKSLSQPRFAAFMLSLFSTAAIVLACIGLYGFISFVVTQRTREIGIRMALGARPSSILKLILNQGLKLGLIGVASGLIVSAALTRLLRALLFGISPNDPATLIGLSAVLIAVIVAACLVPARNATRVNPIVALKQE